MTYEQTHPWISFQLDLSSAPSELWLGLGDARSKCEHLSAVPLRPSTAKRLHGISLARGALASAAIEGNTLTEEDAIRIVEGKSTLPKSQEYLEREIENIIRAINTIMPDIADTPLKPISVEDILEYNRLILDGLELDGHAIAGEFTDHTMVVADYVGIPPEECLHLVDCLCVWLNGKFFTDLPGGKTGSGILKALLAHLYFVWIHPFGDGNGRTARLLEMRFLMEAGVPSTAAHLLSNHYNNTRGEYYRRLADASKKGAVIPFLTYAVSGFVDLLREQIMEIKRQQWDITWENYIHEKFHGDHSLTAGRRRKLIIALSDRQDPVPSGKIRHLTPELAEAYATKTDKTVSRDIGALKEMNLLRSTKTGWQANKDYILAFLPMHKG